MNGITFPFNREKTKIADKTLIAAVRAHTGKSALCISQVPERNRPYGLERLD